MRGSMATKRWVSGRLALAVLLLLASAFHLVRGQAGSPPAAMPGMQMPAPAQSPGASKPVPPGYAEITVASDVQQRIGVALGTVERTPLTMNVRAVGIVRPNETKIAHIHLKTEGWVDKLYVAYTGQKVKAGEPMLSIYSPAFFTAQAEFLAALRSVAQNPEGTADRQIVVESSRRRLQLWDIPEESIARLEKTGKPEKSLTLSSPISGTVLEKKVFDGEYVMPQGELYVVANLSTVWVQARVFEYELPHIEIGMPVTVTLPSLDPQQFTGKVVFIDAVADEMTRSVQVRVELPNPHGQLKPGMFCRVLISHAMGAALTVPTSAVIRTGERDIAFRAASADRFVPVEVKISPMRFEDRFQILEGLQAGDQVVISANFLIDSESRLQAGGGSMTGMPGMGGTIGGKKPQ